MTPSEGYALARYQRPGIKIVMGPHEAREEKTPPLLWVHLRKLPGDRSWVERSLRIKLGFVPSEWARAFGLLATSMGHDVSANEWKWLHGPATLLQAQEWLVNIAEARNERAIT